MHFFLPMIALCMLLLPGAAGLMFSVGNIFGDGMVLQRNVPANIWGWAPAESTVFGSLYNSETNASTLINITSDATGFWVLLFPPQPASPHSYSITVSTAMIEPLCNLYAYDCNGATATLSGVAFGDVIFCSGQSNMQVNVAFAFNSSQELQLANDYSIISVFQSAASVASKSGPLDQLVTVQIPWSPASNTSLPTFSATCWYSGKSIVDGRVGADRDVPLGLVVSTWGGTPIKAWNDPVVNQQCEPLYPFTNASAADCGMHHAPCNNSVLYNSLIAPFVVAPYQPAAFIWFQGENDCTFQEYAFYSCQLGGMINQWRNLFKAPRAPWTTIQLAPYLGGSALPGFRAMQ
jgi:sialate O-acetylesterase